MVTLKTENAAFIISTFIDPGSDANLMNSLVRRLISFRLSMPMEVSSVNGSIRSKITVNLVFPDSHTAWIGSAFTYLGI